MASQNDNILDPDRLSAKETENCLRMLDGASPSGLGISLTDAAEMLLRFARTYRRAIEKDSSLERHLGREIVLNVEQAESLWKFYHEAAELTRQLFG